MSIFTLKLDMVSVQIFWIKIVDFIIIYTSPMIFIIDKNITLKLFSKLFTPEKNNHVNENVSDSFK